MSTVKMCDRCGAVVGKYGSYVLEYKPNMLTPNMRLDLCEKCCEDLNKFVRMENIITNVAGVS